MSEADLTGQYSAIAFEELTPCAMKDNAYFYTTKNLLSLSVMEKTLFEGLLQGLQESDALQPQPSLPGMNHPTFNIHTPGSI